MNATEATHFDTFSAANAAIVEANPCTCEAYKDIFTYGRWKAQGMQVQKGEKATKITTYIPIKKDDPTTGEKVIVGRRQRTSAVFCRCQVAPKEK
jgi:hypothetical protein